MTGEQGTIAGDEAAASLTSGLEVTSLRRVAVGGLAFGTLQSGQWREVRRQECDQAFPRAEVGAGSQEPGAGSRKPG